jgi:hypothetical protein
LVAREEEDDEDEDELIMLSQRPFGSNLKHDRRTGNGMRSLRRRPFLIFDKTEAKGYKQLKSNDQAAKTPMAHRYQPGDGFSGREAKPNGSSLLTRDGKITVTNTHVGMLDLTQTVPSPARQKRKVRRANLDDNSFATAPKKKARRPLAPKDTNQQLKPAAATKSLVQAKTGTSKLDTANVVPKVSAHPPPNKEHTTTDQPRPTTDNGQGQAKPTNGRDDNADDDNGEVDMIIPKSDDIQGNIAENPEARIAEGEEAHGSCGTRVSASPPREVRARARSLTAHPPAESDAAEHESQGVGRVLQRVNTR